MLIAWFVLCAVGVIPNVANAAHAGGLARRNYLGERLAGLLRGTKGERPITTD